MMANAQLCKILKDGIDPDYYFNFTDNFIEKEVSTLNRITYAYIAPLIIAFGIVGDILTVITLTHPLLRRSSIVYTYLTLLAMTDLLTQISIIPMILWLLDRSICTRPTAYYYAHVGFPLVNALMGASVWIVVFLTFSQYMAVCRPFNYGMRSRKVCFILFFCAYIINFGIYAPWALKKRVWQIDVPPEFPNVCEYLVCDSDAQSWYALYAWIREAIARVIPFFLVAFFNTRILITYRNTKADRMKRLSNSQKRFVYEKSEQEERRLFVLLFAIIIVFCVCTIPAAPLTILVADSLSNNLPFQVFRAITNLMEFTKFALNFYFYCLINPDIRRICLNMMLCRKIGRPARVKGQPVNHISQYTR